MTNFLDLFSGIGGFALGARMAGCEFNAHFFSEVDKYAIKVYTKHFPKAIGIGDITRVNWQKLKKENRDQWFIVGGFPCQDISIAGKGEGIKGKRSGLWGEMFKAIRVLLPKYTIIENVAAITFRGLDRVLADLATIGYDAEWTDIRARDMGFPHRRERIFIVAYPTGRSKAGLSRSSTKGQSWPKHNLKYNIKENRIQDEPILCGKHYGLPNRMDRLRSLGNSIVPQIAEMIFNRLK